MATPGLEPGRAIAHQFPKKVRLPISPRGLKIGPRAERKPARGRLVFLLDLVAEWHIMRKYGKG